MGLHGWQWIFLLEGVPPVLLGIGILLFPLLPDRPADAVWLTPRERQWIEEELLRDADHPRLNHVAELRRAAADVRLWLLSVIYFLLIMGLYGFVFWVPTLVKMLTHASDARVGLLSAIPFTIGAITDGDDRQPCRPPRPAPIPRRRLRRTGRRRHLGGGLRASPIFGLAWLCVSAIGIFGTLGPFWTIPTRYLRGTAAAGGIAVINSIGALAGFVVSPTIGWAKTHTGQYTAGLLVVAISLAIGAALVLWVPRRCYPRKRTVILLIHRPPQPHLDCRAIEA